jgi:luciferase family oxidoreductase group 1
VNDRSAAFRGPISVLDYVSINEGDTAHDAIVHSIELAQHVERLGYRRLWFSEHHNTRGLACTAPELIIARVGAETTMLRVGAGGIMLPNHAPLKVAETFHTLEAMYPDRIDLGLGRAPGTDGITALALRRSRQAVLADDFPQQAGELFAFLELGLRFPDDHQFGSIVVAPTVPHPPEVWMLGSSDYGGRFAAVNGLRTAFAHQINPEPAIEVLRDYRRDFRPSEHLAEPYSMISVNAFASERPAEVEDFVAYWTLTMTKLRRNEKTRTTLTEAREFARSADFEVIRSRTGARLVAGSPDEVARELSRLAVDGEVDELMVVTPAPEHAARLRSFELIAAALGSSSEPETASVLHS